MKHKILVGFRTDEGDFEKGKTVDVPAKSAKEALKNGWIKGKDKPDKEGKEK